MAEELNFFENLLDNSAEFEELYDAAKKGMYPIGISGLSDSVRAHIAFCLCRKLDKKLVFISHNEANAKKISEDINYFFGKQPLYFPERELLFYDIEAAGADIKRERLSIIEKITSGSEKFNIVTTIQAFLSPTISRNIYADNVIIIFCC